MSYHEKNIYTFDSVETDLKTEVILYYGDGTPEGEYGSITNPRVQIIVTDTFRHDFHSIFIDARSLDEIAHAVEVAVKELNSGE